MSTNCLKPIAVKNGQPVFEQPWQAQVLAMADLLIQSGQINAILWSRTLGQKLTITQATEDTQENYYQAVLAALVELLDAKTLISFKQLADREADWRQAYLSTPHGQAVILEDDSK